jgi:hypothetical protein
MKKKIHKLLGVVLTATLVASLTVGLLGAPAFAGGNSWSEFDVPADGSTDDYFMDLDLGDLGPMDMAIDGTLYVGAWYDGDPHIFKSTDGRAWDMTDYQDDSDSTDPIVGIVCSTMDADIVYVTDGTEIYWTENGDDFETLATPPVTAGTISSMDVGYISDTPYIFIGTIGDTATQGAYTDDDVWMAEQAGFGLTWEQQLIMTDRASAYTECDIFDVRVGLDFDAETVVMAVVGADIGVDDDHTYITSKKGGAQWGATKGDGELKYDADPSPLSFRIDVDGDATIWMPDDFDSDDRELFVGVDDDGGLGGDVYWCISTTIYDLDIVASDDETDVTDLHAAGNVGDASLIAATYGGDMRYSDDYGDSWSKNKKKPTGDDASYVRVAADFLDSEEAWAATNGPDAAVSFTSDMGSLWNGIGLIDTDMGTIVDIAPAPDFDGSSGAFFMVTQEDDTPPTPGSSSWFQGESLWKYDGDNWERIFHYTLMDSDVYAVYISDVEVSPEWESDECVLFADRNNNRAYRSTDGGGRFRRANSAAADPTSVQGASWLVIDADTRLVGADNGKIYKTSNNGTTWSGKTAGDSNDVIYSLALDPNNPDNVLAGDDDGTVYLSDDGGGDWTDKGTPEAGIAFVAFDPEYATNDTMYAAVRGGSIGVYRRNDTTWDDISGLEGTWPEDIDSTKASVDPDANYNIVVGPDGVMYVVDMTDDESAVVRSYNPASGGTSGDDGVYFETINSGWGDDGKAWGLWLLPGSNKLYTINADQAEIWEYTDEVTAPSLSTPSDGSSSERIDEVTLKWNAVSNADEYVIFVGKDPGFPYYDWYITTTTDLRVMNLEDGKTYYWKAAVWTGEPVLSDWSSTWSFTTALSAAQWNPFIGGVPEAPANGATNVPLTPTFAWNPADWATGYEFVLARDAGFTDVVVSKTGANALSSTAYLSEQELDYSTTYYWQVRAIGQTTQSEWATGVFTTEGEPPPPPEPPAPPPPPEPPPPTPAYIWVIIGVGAALVIAVIILIVRTRRPA